MLGCAASHSFIFVSNIAAFSPWFLLVTSPFLPEPVGEVTQNSLTFNIIPLVTSNARGYRSEPEQQVSVRLTEMLVRVATELKHIFDTYPQSSRDHEGHLQGWRVTICLNGDYSLARDAYTVCKI